MDLLVIVCCITNIIVAITVIEYINDAREKINIVKVSKDKKKPDDNQYEPYLILNIIMPDDVTFDMVESIDVQFKDSTVRALTWMYTKYLEYIGNNVFIAKIGCIFYKNSPPDAEKLTITELSNILEIQKFNYYESYSDKKEIHLIDFYEHNEKIKAENAN